MPLVPQHLGPPLTRASYPASLKVPCSTSSRNVHSKDENHFPTSQSLLGLSSAVLAVWPVVPAVPLCRLAGGYMSSEAAASGPSVVSGASCFPSA